jgi:hypothetical protein
MSSSCNLLPTESFPHLLSHGLPSIHPCTPLLALHQIAKKELGPLLTVNLSLAGKEVCFLPFEDSELKNDVVPATADVWKMIDAWAESFLGASVGLISDQHISRGFPVTFHHMHFWRSSI